MMTYAEVLRHYRGAGVLLDTNLLMLLFVGMFDRELIERFKRTQQFTADDYDLLNTIIAPLGRIITTPNILTEVSNLSNQLPEWLKTGYFEVLAAQIAQFDEVYIASQTLSEISLFWRFGLTDLSILEAARIHGYLVLTADLPLYAYLATQNIPVINFNHLRTY